MSFFAVADAIGLMTFAVSGYLAGVRKELDLLGVVIAAYLTALGGGIVRDVMVGHTPIAFLESSVHLFVLAGIVAAYLFKLHAKARLERHKLFMLSDSIGLVSFAMTGALTGLEAEFNLFGTMLLAFVTAVGGGMVRDTMIGEVPMVLTSDIYGTIALLIGLILFMCDRFECLGPISLALTAGGALAIRILAYKKGWHLPKFGVKR